MPPLPFSPSTKPIYSFRPLQHVGTQHYETYFKLVDWALKDKDATAVVTSTTFPEAHYMTYQPEDFMRRYMWPNSALPCATTLINAATKASKNRFSVQFVENHGAHYPRTLREWGRRLESNVTMDTMAKRYPGLRDPAAFESFKRKWRYLFAYAGAGFAKGYISCHMLTFYKVWRGSESIERRVLRDADSNAIEWNARRMRLTRAAFGSVPFPCAASVVMCCFSIHTVIL